MQTKPTFKRYGALLFATIIALVSSVHADTIVPQHGRESVNVTSGSSAISGVVAIADDARLVKTGTGTATLDKENLVSPNAPHIDVLAGNLEIGTNGGTPVQPAAPSAVMSRASFWLAADADNAHFSTSLSDGNTVVNVWRDVRDTNASATNYPYAGTPVSDGFVSPILQTVDGKQGVYFRGYKSKCTMLLHKADGTAYTSGREKMSVGTAFAVTRIDNSWGNMLGNYVNDDSAGLPHYYHLSDYSNGGVVLKAYHANMRDPVMRTMRFFDNGESRDHNRDYVRTGMRVIEYCHSASAKGAFDSLFGQAKTANREGGDHLMEFIVFDEALSEEDRLSVERYLATKWGVTTSSVNLRVADGATATVSTDGLTVMPSGNGVVEAEADGIVFATGETAEFGGGVKLADSVSAKFYGPGVAVALDAGDSLDVAKGDNTTAFGLETATLTKAAPVGMVEKTGTGTARINALPHGVSKLSVKGGSVVLAASPADTPPASGAADIHATIPNHDFESSDMSAWSLTSDGERWTGRHRRSDQTTLAPYDAPQGTYFLMLKRGGSDAEGVPAAQTTVSVPVTGRYELTFYGSGRKDYGLGLFQVQFISGSTTLSCDETDCFWISTGYRLHRVLTPELTAGNWTMRIAPNFAAWDTTAEIDDLHMTLATESIPADGSWTLPNGRFENLVYHTSDNPTYASLSGQKCSLNDPAQTTANVVEGWTFSANDSSGNPPRVGLVDEAMFSRSAWYSSPYLCRYGKKVLGFWSNGGTATSAAFSPPAGRWQLRFKSAFAGSQNLNASKFWRGNALTTMPQWSVSISVNGATALTATSSTSGFNKWKTALIDGSFDVVDGDIVTVAISQEERLGAGYIDDVELVPANLVQNGGFETGSLGAWSGGSVVAYTANTGIFGTDVCEGSYFLQIQGLAAASQTLQVPAAGLYRIGLHTRTASGLTAINNHYAFDPIEVRVMQGSATNFIAVADAATDTFRPYSWLWNAPAAGSYTLVVAGTVDARKYTLVDVVSVAKCDAVAATATPDISKNTGLHVAAGATVALDFPGSLELDTLHLGGRLAHGEPWSQGERFSAATHPEYFTGTGSIYVRPKATVLYVR